MAQFEILMWCRVEAVLRTYVAAQAQSYLKLVSHCYRWNDASEKPTELMVGSMGAFETAVEGFLG